MATDDETKIKRLLDEVGAMLSTIPLENTEKALSLYPFLKKKVENSSDRLLTAVRIAIAGNVID
jgi:tellurite resistance protein